jgi:hypothetical protein
MNSRKGDVPHFLGMDDATFEKLLVDSAFFTPRNSADEINALGPHGRAKSRLYHGVPFAPLLLNR